MMSPKLPRVTGKEAIRALKRAGFEIVRKSGSHHFLSHLDDSTRWATVAVHSEGNIPLGTLNNILKTARISADELRELL